MSNSNTDTCYEYFKCKELSCIRREYPSKQCWEVDDVLCKSHSHGFQQIKEHFDNKLDACKLCIYYQNNH